MIQLILFKTKQNEILKSGWMFLQRSCDVYCEKRDLINSDSSVTLPDSEGLKSLIKDICSRKRMF